jgi:hypothetical protein
MPEPTLKRANAIRYCFDDPDLDFMFQWAAGAPQDRRARPRRAVLHRLRHGWEAEAWHAALSVRHKTFLRLDGATGADAHCQVNNPTRLAQEVYDWLNEFFGAIS